MFVPRLQIELKLCLTFHSLVSSSISRACSLSRGTRASPQPQLSPAEQAEASWADWAWLEDRDTLFTSNICPSEMRTACTVHGSVGSCVLCSHCQQYNNNFQMKIIFSNENNFLLSALWLDCTLYTLQQFSYFLLSREKTFFPPPTVTTSSTASILPLYGKAVIWSTEAGGLQLSSEYRTRHVNDECLEAAAPLPGARKGTEYANVLPQNMGGFTTLQVSANIVINQIKRLNMFELLTKLNNVYILKWGRCMALPWEQSRWMSDGFKKDEEISAHQCWVW